MASLSRGSEWRKWDLHVHTPKSFLNNQFKDVSIETFVNRIVDSGIAVIGLTNYFRFEETELTEIKEELEKKGVVVFPNIEFRIKPENKENEDMHIHIIFNNQIDDINNKISGFLTRLKTIDDKYCNDLTPTEIESTTISLSTIFDTLKLESSLVKDKDYFIIACPRGQGSFRPKKGDGRSENTALTIDKKSDILFGKTLDVDYFLDTNRYDNAISKPVFFCSDAHKLDDIGMNYTWVKADTTFKGLQQVVYHPSERVYIGPIPPKLDKAIQNKNIYIDSVSIDKNTTHNTTDIWFDCEIPLNLGLNIIIGNKGSGKSALSDIIGHLCKCKTINKYASFLDADRFRRFPEKLADKYKGKLKWMDGNVNEQPTLGEVNYGTTIEDAQYLPQRYIDKVCNDLDNEFQTEIDKVIFSYIDISEKGETKDLKELISMKSRVFESKILDIKSVIHEINKNIIMYEKRLAPSYKKIVEDNLVKRKDDLTRQEANRPKEIVKPTESKNPEYVKKLQEIDVEIARVQQEVEEKTKELIKINKQIQMSKDLEEKSRNLIENIEKFNIFSDSVSSELNLKKELIRINYSFNSVIISDTIKKLESNKKDINILLMLPEEDKENKSLYTRKEKLEKEKLFLISKESIKEKEYQKYLQDLKLWEKTKNEIIGDITVDNSISYLLAELKNINEIYPLEYEKLKKSRLNEIENIYNQKVKKAQIYSELYKPIESTIGKLLGQSSEKINFKINFLFKDKNIVSTIMDNINLRISGKFQGKENAYTRLNSFVKQTDCNDVNSIKNFLEEIFSDIYNDLENSSKKIMDKEKYYNLLSSLDYVDIEYSLRMGDVALDKLSPGEKGILLLIFYLALNKEEKPLIIDQPEDNLDNQSVFNRLVPAICEAKKKRQVIIVTHNPNIAIACDAELVIYSYMDKSNNKISYETGAIENPKIQKHIIDVLEGTIPAFDLRTLKYSKKYRN